ncbi:hypothetical protein ACFLX7_05265, partial [Chloroflexota bacterium]
DNIAIEEFRVSVFNQVQILLQSETRAKPGKANRPGFSVKCYSKESQLSNPNKKKAEKTTPLRLNGNCFSCYVN